MTAVLAVPAAQPAEDSAARGRTTVAPRALDHVVSAVAAETFGVTPREVRVDLTDREGLLAVRIRTPVRTPPLERIRTTPSRYDGAKESLLHRARDAQTTIRDRVSVLTGAAIAHVTVELTGIDIQHERRVR